MAFICPACAAPALEIGATLELPYDTDWDEITLQVLACRQCGLGALAVYREERHGSLDSETVAHEGYRVSAADLEDVAAVLALCPRPADDACACAAHRRFGAQRAGRWLGLAAAGLQVERAFRLER